MHGRAPAGFTLVETLIALVIASFLVVLVSHAFLVQNEFYSLQTLRIGVQDNTRAATELVAREVRNVPSDGVVVAGRRTLTIRSPIVVATVCNRQGPSLVDVMSGGGEASVAVGPRSTGTTISPPTTAKRAEPIPSARATTSIGSWE